MKAGRPKKVLHVLVESAAGIQNTSYFSAQDPYCSVSTEDKSITKRTAAHMEGGTEPKWDSGLLFTQS